MAVEVGTLAVRLQGETRQFQQSLREATRMLQSVSRSAESSARVASSATSRVAAAYNMALKPLREYERGHRRLQQALAVTTQRIVFLQLDLAYVTQTMRRAAAAATGLAAAMGGAAVKFEDAFAGVRKTVDATDEEFRALERNLRGLSRQMVTSATDLAEIAAVAGQMGIRGVSNLTKFTKVVAELALATNVVGEEGARDLARLMNVTGTAVEQVDRLASSLVALGNEFATTEREILDMAQLIAGAGRTVGLSTAQILALATALSAVGIEAERGGSAISRVLIEMYEAVSKQNSQLRVFARTAGVSAGEFTDAFKRDPVRALQLFIKGLRRVDEAGGNVFDILEQVGASDIRVRDTVLRLYNAVDQLTSAVRVSEAAWRDNTALMREVEKRHDTAAAQLRILWNDVTEIARTVGDAYLPAIKEVVRVTRQWLRTFEDMTPQQAQAIAKITLLTAAALGLTTVLLTTTTTLLTLGTGLVLFIRLVTALLNPWALLVAGILFGAKVLGISLGDVRAAAEAAAAWLKNVKDLIVEKVTSAWEWTLAVTEPTRDWLQTVALPALREYGGKTLDTAWNLTLKGYEEAKQAVEALAQRISELDLKLPAVDATGLTQSLEAARRTVEEFRWPELPTLTVPEIDAAAFLQSLSELEQGVPALGQKLEQDVQQLVGTVRTLNGELANIQVPESIRNLAREIASQLSDTPAAKTVLNIGELSREVMAGDKTLGEAILEAIKSNISIPLAAATISLLPLPSGWKLALTGVVLALNLLPNVDLSWENMVETARNLWRGIQDGLARAFQYVVMRLNIPELEVPEDRFRLSIPTIEDLARRAVSWSEGLKVDPELRRAVAGYGESLGNAVADAIIWAIDQIPRVAGIIAAIQRVANNVGEWLGEQFFEPFIGAFISTVGKRLKEELWQRFVDWLQMNVLPGQAKAPGPIVPIKPAVPLPKEIVGWLEQIQQSVAMGWPFESFLIVLADDIKKLNLSAQQLAETMRLLEAIMARLGPSGEARFREFRRRYGFQSGAILPGKGGPDQIPALLAPGEAVVPADVVQGGWRAVLAWFKQMGVPGFQQGGFIDPSGKLHPGTPFFSTTALENYQKNNLAAFYGSQQINVYVPWKMSLEQARALERYVREAIASAKAPGAGMIVVAAGGPRGALEYQIGLPHNAQAFGDYVEAVRKGSTTGMEAVSAIWRYTKEFAPEHVPYYIANELLEPVRESFAKEYGYNAKFMEDLIVRWLHNTQDPRVVYGKAALAAQAGRLPSPESTTQLMRWATQSGVRLSVVSPKTIREAAEIFTSDPDYLMTWMVALEGERRFTEHGIRQLTGGEKDVLVYRGVRGQYAELLLEALRGKGPGTAFHSGPVESWTLSRDMAEHFTEYRKRLGGPPVILRSRLPIDQFLASVMTHRAVYEHMGEFEMLAINPSGKFVLVGSPEKLRSIGGETIHVVDVELPRVPPLTLPQPEFKTKMGAALSAAVRRAKGLAGGALKALDVLGWVGDVIDLLALLRGEKVPGGWIEPTWRSLYEPGMKLQRGAILPGVSGPDRIPALLAPGEAVVPAKVVRGGWPAVLQWFRSMGVPGFQTGGVVGNIPPDLAAAQTMVTKTQAELEKFSENVVSSVERLATQMEKIFFGAIEFLAKVLQKLFPQHAEEIRQALDDLKAFWQNLWKTPPGKEETGVAAQTRARVDMGKEVLDGAIALRVALEFAKVSILNTFENVRDAFANMYEIVVGGAKRVWEDAREAVTTGWQQLWSGIQTGLANVIYAIFTPGNLTGAITATAQALWNFATSVMTGLVNAVAQASGALQSVIAGAQQGGVVGAILAILMQSEQFQEAVAIVNHIIELVANALGKIIEAALPFLSILTILAEGILPIFEPILNIFAEALKALWPVFRFVAIVILRVAKFIGDIWNGIVGAIQNIFRAIGNLSVFGWKPFNFLNDWANSLEKAKIDTQAMAKAIQELENLTWEEAMAKAEAIAATKEFTEALTNVPEGFKVALARYQAMEPVHLQHGGLVTGPTYAMLGERHQPELVIPLDRLDEFEGGGGETIVIVFEGNVYGFDDFESKVMAAVERARQRRSARRHGTLIEPAPTYLS